MNIHTEARERISDLRIAGRINPFDLNMRLGSADAISLMALQSHNRAWLEAADIEISHALAVDYTNAEILQKGILVAIALDKFAEARIYYAQFKRVDRKSPILKLVAQAHQQGRTPVAAKP